MLANKKISLFWWSEKRLMKKEKENYGDLISKYIVEKLSGKNVEWVHPKKQGIFNFNQKHYLAVGSILQHATRHSIVWGSGIVDREKKIANAQFLAVRGPETMRHLNEQGLDCPEIYGDPALLMPGMFFPKIEKKYKFGILPHYVEYKVISEKYSGIENLKVIDLMTNDVEKTTSEILACERIVSSSLHGVIVAHAYGIPAIWHKFSNKVFGDDVKYMDYYESVGIFDYEVSTGELDLMEDSLLERIFTNPNCIPNKAKLEDLQTGLVKACPFVKPDFEFNRIFR